MMTAGVLALQGTALSLKGWQPHADKCTDTHLFVVRAAA